MSLRNIVARVGTIARLRTKKKVTMRETGMLVSRRKTVGRGIEGAVIMNRGMVKRRVPARRAAITPFTSFASCEIT